MNLPGVYLHSRIGKLLSGIEEIREALGPAGAVASGPTTGPAYPPRSRPLNFELPRIVVVGEESSGKSSVLARLCQLDFFPKATGVCTRMPIELHLQQKTEHGMREFCSQNNFNFNPRAVHVQVTADGVTSAWLGNDQIAQLRSLIQVMMNEMVTARNRALTGIIEDSIVINVVSMLVPTLTLVDLPGLMAATRPNEPLNLPELTETMVRRYIGREHTLVVAVIPASERLNNSRVIGLIQRLGKVHMAVGVLTKIDLAVPADVRRRLTGTAEDFIALGKPYVGTRNPNTTNPREMEVPLDEWSMVNEKEYFQENFPELARDTGASVLAKRVMMLLDDYVKNTWATEARGRLAAYRRELQVQLLSLGLFHDASSVAPDWNALFASVKDYLVDELLRNAMNTSDTVFEKAIDTAMQQSFRISSTRRQIPFVQQRMEYVTEARRLENETIPLYIGKVTTAIIQQVKLLLESDTGNTWRVCRFSKLSDAIIRLLEWRLAMTTEHLECALKELIRPTGTMADLQNTFVGGHPVRILTVDVLVVPLLKVVSQLDYVDGLLDEDEETTRRRTKLNAAIARVPDLETILTSFGRD
ncbi:P-loop containing nucleoside triphosphate hydrolase protein [Powellomyces hirtus]|nr:P-loop containing nucleoside triphosphate hydrolase protein [Powellomyces hirtus]